MQACINPHRVLLSIVHLQQKGSVTAIVEQMDHKLLCQLVFLVLSLIQPGRLQQGYVTVEAQGK